MRGEHFVGVGRVVGVADAFWFGLVDFGFWFPGCYHIAGVVDVSIEVEDGCTMSADGRREEVSSLADDMTVKGKQRTVGRST